MSKDLKQATAEPVDKPFGQVTVRRLSQRHANHADQYQFYPTGQPPYLDNVDECHTVYTHPAPSVPGGLTWFTVAEHGMPDFDEEVIGGFWYTDPWLKPEFATRFLWGLCRVFKDDPRDFKDGKRWYTSGPSHNEITHWARLNKPTPPTPKKE